MAARTMVVAVLWLASLVLVGTIARAQALPGVETRVLSGGDIGFRVEGMQGNAPSGTLVVRWNGQWVEPVWPKKVVTITR